MRKRSKKSTTRPTLTGSHNVYILTKSLHFPKTSWEQTNRQTDIVTYRAAIVAKNDTHFCILFITSITLTLTHYTKYRTHCMVQWNLNFKPPCQTDNNKLKPTTLTLVEIHCKLICASLIQKDFNSMHFNLSSTSTNFLSLI